jgi:hypothetical protein
MIRRAFAMPNEEHLKILKQGPEVWNRWRAKSEAVMPDLNGADLSGANLYNADFRDTDLSHAKLIRVNLNRANFSRASLINTGFGRSHFDGANFSHAKLIGAKFAHVEFFRTDLTQADLTGALLANTNLSYSNLSGANFSEATLTGNVFAGIDLSTVKGLESVNHLGPSSIGLDTVYRSKGNIPEVFLRGAGVPDNFIAYMHSLTGKAFEFYSCFISYSSKDEPFAKRLYSDLQSNGIRCWFAPEDLKIGDRIRVGIDESIRNYDKLLLILSKRSVASDWVEKEVETAMERERNEKCTVLFPIRLDDEVIKIESGWPADIRRGRNIGDFRRWKAHDEYDRAFQRLIRDLRMQRFLDLEKG